MRRLVGQLFLKQKNTRNLYFAIALIGVATIFFAISFIEGFLAKDYVELVWLFLMFFYVWVLTIYGGEIGSGMLSKQLSNGLSRGEAYIQMLIFSVLFSLIYYIVIILILVCFSLAHTSVEEILLDFIGIPFLSIICLSQITLFLVLMVKKTLKSILLGYFVFLQFEPLPARFLSKYIDPHFMLISPHHLAKQLIMDNNQVNILLQVGVILIFTTLFSFLSYKRIQKMDFV